MSPLCGLQSLASPCQLWHLAGVGQVGPLASRHPLSLRRAHFLATLCALQDLEKEHEDNLRQTPWGGPGGGERV